MIESTRTFRRLVISDQAFATAQGARIADAFQSTGRPIVHKTEADLDRGSTVGSLVCGYRPSRGWIERAEHGTLSMRSNEYYLNPIVGCRSRCTYCYLQASGARLPLRIYVGTDELLGAIDGLLAALPRSVEPLLCTGEQADSLADSHIYPVGGILVEAVARHRRGLLELRTKSADVESLLGLDHRDRTVVAFSLAPDRAIAAYEGGTASLDERLDAARRCQMSGYAVALKLEPLHVDPAWHSDYRDLIAHIARTLDLNGIAHVAIGSLRAGAALLGRPVFRRHHGLALVGGERVAYRPAKTNAMPAQADRWTAYRYIENLIRDSGIQSRILWSMETRAMISSLGHMHDAAFALASGTA